MKKKLLIFRFENVLINCDSELYYLQQGVWELLQKLKKQGYDLGLITSLSFESFAKAATSSVLVSNTIHRSFGRLIQRNHPEYQLNEFLRFAEKNNIKKEEIVYFGNHYNHFEAAKKYEIDFIGVVDHFPTSGLLNNSLPNDEQPHPVLMSVLLNNSLPDDEKTSPLLLAEFLTKYLELTQV